MQPAKQQALQRRGWKAGSAKDFLALSDEEATLIDLKIALGHALRQRRRRQRLTQEAVAKVIGSSQSRVAKMEAGDPSASIDLIIRSMLTLGASRRDVARAIASREG